MKATATGRPQREWRSGFAAQWLALALGLASCAQSEPLPVGGAGNALPTSERIDAEVRRQMAAAQIKGLAWAVIDQGRVTHVQSHGQRNGTSEGSAQPLQTDTVMYGASLTKAVFAYAVMQLVDEGRIALDTSIALYLDKPLPDYGVEPGRPDWSALARDERWRRLTPRILLSHRAGFANFASLEPDRKLRFHFEPGTRYAYSGDGLNLLQFVLERGLGIDVEQEIQRGVFDRFGMARSAMRWRADLAENVADGYTADGTLEPHSRRGRVRAAGSMDTTVADFARFAAGFVRGEGLTAQARADMVSAQGPITTARQFPTLMPELPVDRRRADLVTGLGVIVFNGPQGPGFYKGGHDESTGNTWVCLERAQRCVVLLSNDVRAEALFPGLVAFVLGDTGVPWDWEYGR